jgi:hypothetical protein
MCYNNNTKLMIVEMIYVDNLLNGLSVGILSGFLLMAWIVANGE